MNNEDEYKPLETFPTDEFVKVCEELGLLEPTINEISEDMWSAIPKFEDSNW